VDTCLAIIYLALKSITALTGVEREAAGNDGFSRDFLDTFQTSKRRSDFLTLAALRMFVRWNLFACLAFSAGGNGS
jgi:hypothetical protein